MHVHSSDCLARALGVLPADMPSGSSARGRSPVTQKDFKRARDDLNHTKDRVDQMERRLGVVGDLAVPTAQDVAALRAELQLVFFARGSAKAALAAELADYNGGKAAVANGTADRGPPLKVRMYSWAIHSLANANRPPPDDKPWVLLRTFAASESGRTLRRLWGAASLATLWTKLADGQWPPMGVKAGVPRPSRKVLAAADAVGLQLKGKGHGKGTGHAARVSPKRSASGDGDDAVPWLAPFSGCCLCPGAGSGLVQASDFPHFCGVPVLSGPLSRFPVLSGVSRAVYAPSWVRTPDGPGYLLVDPSPPP